MKKMLFLPLFLVIFLAGCELTQEEKQSIHEGAVTAQATAQNFDAMKDKIVAKDPNDAPAVEQWKADHSISLNAAAKAMADVDQRVNAKMLQQLAQRDLEAKKQQKLNFAPGK